MQAKLPGAPFPPGPRAIVLEAPAGRERRSLLEAWAADARRGAAGAWVLCCDAERGGLWAGVGSWLESILPALEAAEPELFVRHDGELTLVLPELRTRVRPRYVTLTEASHDEEAVRNYAATRANRVPQGLIDLLADWHRASGGGRWVVACDDYDRAGPSVRRFFRELVRRRGAALDLVILVAVEPGAGDAAAEDFAAHAPVQRVRMDLPAGPAERVDAAEMARRAAELEAHARTDTLLMRMHAHEVIRLWTAAGRADRAADWHGLALGILTQMGFYEDAMRHVAPVLDNLAMFDGPGVFYPRSTLVNKIQVMYVATGQMEAARDLLQREGLDQLTDPVERSRAMYQMAMLHARFLPKRDLDAGERFLRDALAELDRAEMEPGDRQFLVGFILNGLAYVRFRQGDAREAATLSHENFDRLDRHLPAERHRLHRSVLLYNAGQVYAQSGNLEEAARYFSEAMEMDPFYSEYYNDRGNLYLKLGRLEEAERDYLRAIELSSPYPEVWFNLGQCLTRLNRPAEAEQAYARAVDLKPDYHEAWANLARTRLALGRREQALDAYDAAVRADGTNPFVLANRAALRFQLGHGPAALADLDRAVELAPENAALARNRAVALQALGLAPAPATAEPIAL